VSFQGLSFPWFVLARVFVLARFCHGHVLFWPGFAMSRVCSGQGLSWPGFILARVCPGQVLSCPGFVMSRACHVQGLLVFPHAHSTADMTVRRKIGGIILYNSVHKR
jgi:hypothetical protein